QEARFERIKDRGARHFQMALGEGVAWSGGAGFGWERVEELAGEPGNVTGWGDRRVAAEAGEELLEHREEVGDAAAADGQVPEGLELLPAGGVAGVAEALGPGGLGGGA